MLDGQLEQREIEIEGDSADILSNTVQLMNVMAKAYAEEVPVTVTADRALADARAAAELGRLALVSIAETPREITPASLEPGWSELSTTDQEVQDEPGVLLDRAHHRIKCNLRV